MLGLFVFLAFIVIFMLLFDARGRLKRAEATLEEAAKRIGALQRHAGLLPPRVDETPEPEPVAAEPSETAAETRERWKNRPTATAAAAGAPLPSVEQDVRGEPDTGPAESLPTPTAPPEPPAPQTSPPPGITARFENLFGKTLPIWAGGITLAIAGVLIVRYAIDAGFFARIFTPGVQIIAGLLFGFGLIGSAEYAWRNEDRLRDVRVPQALAGAGIATLYAAILVAANVYGLIAPLSAFVALALVTAAALALALRFGPPSALLGLAGGLAAPALVGALAPNVPLLAVYLGLTIAGLTGVARMRRWPWLALAALIGGAGWSLWMMLATNALATLGALSTGGFILLLAVVLPMLAFDGPRSMMLRSAAAIVGALQLALLVGTGGFAPLHWGLFALLAVAGQWLAWRERDFAIVPTISLALAVLLLAVWTDPAVYWFAFIGLSLATIHALPLLARQWAVPGGLRRTLELCGLALAAVPLVRWHYWEITDAKLALVALGGALLVGVGIARGWKVAERAGDTRFAWLTATGSALFAFAGLLLLPPWMAPFAIGGVAAGLLFFGKAAQDWRIEPIAAAFVGAALLALMASPLALDELTRLVEGSNGGDASHALLRWTGVTLLLGLFATKGEHRVVRWVAAALAALFAYGAFAQVVSGAWLMLVPAIGGALALRAAGRIEPARAFAAAASFAALSLAWAALPLWMWATIAGLSLGGVPMRLGAAELGIDALLLRLLLPALLFGAALWLVRVRMPRWLLLTGLCIAAIVGAIAVHSLYRIGFAAAVGGEFVATGMAQRLVWEALLIGGGWIALARRLPALARPLVVAGTAHLLWYGLVLHNPLWSAQAVGAWPLVNLLAPLFLLGWLGVRLLVRLFAAVPQLERVGHILTMLIIAGFAWATLRQLFHGSVLVDPGVESGENILRSILILGLAIGFLLWGIAKGRHDWRIASLLLMLGAVGKVFLFDASGLEGLLRIASFVVLGFSLIGIGWLYSRQLARPAEAAG